MMRPAAFLQPGLSWGGGEDLQWYFPFPAEGGNARSDADCALQPSQSWQSCEESAAVLPCMLLCE